MVKSPAMPLDLFVDGGQQLTERDVKGCGDLLLGREARVDVSSLDPADVRAVEPGRLGEVLLPPLSAPALEPDSAAKRRVQLFH